MSCLWGNKKGAVARRPAFPCVILLSAKSLLATIYPFDKTRSENAFLPACAATAQPPHDFVAACASIAAYQLNVE
jgi:hypothetical protein